MSEHRMVIGDDEAVHDAGTVLAIPMVGQQLVQGLSLHNLVASTVTLGINFV